MRRVTMGVHDLKAVKRGESLSQQVYQKLRFALISGAFTPGQRMTTRSLAATMQVSLTPAREALGCLVAEGALELASNRVIQVPILPESQIVEIYAMRRMLEGMAAESCIGRLGREQITRLGRLVAAHEAALDLADYRGALANNYRFHFSLYEAAGLPIVLRVIEGLWLQIGSTMNLLYPDFALTRKGTENHRGMIAAVQAGDAKALTGLIRRDITQGEKSVTEALRRLAASSLAA